MFKIKIDGLDVVAHDGETILEVASRAKILIPTLCYLKEFEATSNCRICLVEVVGQKNLVTACSFKVFDGMEVLTKTEKVLSARKLNLELLLSNHNYDCKNCVRQGRCDLAVLAKEYGATGKLFLGTESDSQVDNSSPCVVRDNSKCILCKKCVQVCSKMQAVNAIATTKRGFNTQISSAFNKGLEDSSCVGCGQCIMVCPTGALHESFNIIELEKILNDKTKHKIVASAPAVRVAIAEALGISPKEAENLIPAVLKAIGFDKVFDINFGADLTVLEESNEFLERFKLKKNLPLFTSCCPAWVDFVSKFYPEFNKNVSSCKSPLMMFGAVAKTYYAEKVNVDAKNISVVSVMPCTAKKKERIPKADQADVDCVITVRELLYIIRKKKIDIKKLQPTRFDSLLGESSGAGVIFGASGGVMEAALRTLADRLTNKDLTEIEYTSARGLDGVKLATINIDKMKINIAVVGGLNNAKMLLEKIKNKELNLHFVEVMSCPGGCINGGGMPRIPRECYLPIRAKGLYDLDGSRKVRKAHQNKEVLDFISWQEKSKTQAQLHTR